MKKSLIVTAIALTAILVSALVPACSALADGAVPRGVTDGERYELNVFLSNFTEQAFTAYDANTSDATLAEFAALHLWYNRRNAWEYGEWQVGNWSYAYRIPAADLPAVCQRFFGRQTQSLTPLHHGYDGAYVYHEGEGAPGDTRGFASVSCVEALGGGVFRAYFGAYGAGTGWTNEDCRLRPEQAAAKYADFPVYTGAALIVSEGGTLDSRQTFTLLELSLD